MTRSSLNFFTILTVGIFVPWSVLAANSPVQDVAEASFCSSIDERSQLLVETVRTKNDEMIRHDTEWPERRDEHRDAQDARLGEARSKADERRIEWYDRLDNVAKTEREEEAVVKFKEAAEEAIDTRREAIDRILLEFRADADRLFEERRATLAKVRSAFVASVTTATVQAKSDCANSMNDDVAMKRFRESFESSRKKLKDDATLGTPPGKSVKEIAAQKTRVLQVVLDQFDKEIETAKMNLKRSLDENLDS